ncbi:MAG: glycosyltransferase family 2 protein [Mycobacteriales bacterium]
MAAELVDVGVVTWNTRELSATGLRRLMDSEQGVPFRLLVHDNASTDGTGELIAAVVPEAEVEVADLNSGYAAGVNALMRRSQAGHVLILNGDACPRPGALGQLLTAARQHPQAAVVAPKLLRPDGTVEHSTYPFPSLPVAALFATGLRSLLPHRWAEAWCLDDDWTHSRSRWVDWAMGAAWLIPRVAYEVVGPLDESFFMYGEDVEWCWRARQKGLRTWFESSAVVEHLGNASGRLAFGAQREALVLRNTQRLYRSYRGKAAASAFRRLNARAAGRSARKARRQGDVATASYWDGIRSAHRRM